MVNLPTMSIRRIIRLVSASSAVFLIVFSCIHLLTSRYLEQQLRIHAIDSANATAMSVSPHIARGDWELASTLIQATLQNSFHESIRVYDAQQQTYRIGHAIELPPKTWLIHLIPHILPASPVARTPIMDNWETLGHIEVTTSNRDALVFLEWLSLLALLLSIPIARSIDSGTEPPQYPKFAQLLKRARNNQYLTLYHQSNYRHVSEKYGRAIADTLMVQTLRQLPEHQGLSRPFDDDYITLSSTAPIELAVDGLAQVSIKINLPISPTTALQLLETKLTESMDKKSKERWIKSANLSLWQQAVVDNNGKTIYNELYARLTSRRGVPISIKNLLLDTHTMQQVDQFVLDRASYLQHHRSDALAVNISRYSLKPESNLSVDQLVKSKLIIEFDASAINDQNCAFLQKLTDNNVRLVAQGVNASNIDSLVKSGIKFSQVKIRHCDWNALSHNAMSSVCMMGIPIIIYQMGNSQLIDSSGRTEMTTLYRQGSSISAAKQVTEAKEQ